jgi:hypothetical protein
MIFYKSEKGDTKSRRVKRTAVGVYRQGGVSCLSLYRMGHQVERRVWSVCVGSTALLCVGGANEGGVFVKVVVLI